MSGWIKLHRSLKDNGHLSMPGSTLKIWIWILLTACHDTTKLKDVVLQPGELLASYDRITQDLNLTRTTVSKALKYLESGEYITIKKRAGKANIISVNNWSKYQLDTASTTEEVVLPYPENEPPVQKIDYHQSKKWTTTSPKNRLLPVQKIDSYKNVLQEMIDRWQERIGLISPSVYQMLSEWSNKVEPSLIIEAIDRTAKRRDEGKISGNIGRYFNGIMTDWYNKHITTLADLTKHETAVARDKSKRKKGVVPREYDESEFLGYKFN